MTTNQYQEKVTDSKTICPKPKPYSDYLIEGIPIWQKENRGMTEEEAEAYKEEVARIGRGRDKGESNGTCNGNGKSKLAKMAEANLSGDGIMPSQRPNESKDEGQ